MTAFVKRQLFRRQRKNLKLLGIALILAVIYFGFLTVQNHQARLYFQNLRETDPVRYLEDVRKSEGFESYLDKLRLLEGYGSFQEAAPPFLIGRWTLKEAPERVAPGYVFPDCRDPVLFESGAVVVGSGQDRQSFATQYRITDNDIYLRIAGGDVVKVELISYAAGIDHLELVPPGRGEKRYAYLCGN